jgi:hypothetical protein
MDIARGGRRQGSLRLAHLPFGSRKPAPPRDPQPPTSPHISFGVTLAHAATTVGPLLQATRTVPVVFPTAVDPVGV